LVRKVLVTNNPDHTGSMGKLEMRSQGNKFENASEARTARVNGPMKFVTGGPEADFHFLIPATRSRDHCTIEAVDQEEG
jgi:hypothetical protein